GHRGSQRGYYWKYCFGYWVSGRVMADLAKFAKPAKASWTFISLRTLRAWRDPYYPVLVFSVLRRKTLPNSVSSVAAFELFIGQEAVARMERSVIRGTETNAVPGFRPLAFIRATG
ncbi:MAG: hypothetical protein WD750_02755, partial [Gammaproteobacteria bacterium]